MNSNRFQVLAPQTEGKPLVKEQESSSQQKEKSTNIFKKNTFKKSAPSFSKNEFPIQKTTSKFGNNSRNDRRYSYFDRKKDEKDRRELKKKEEAAKNFTYQDDDFPSLTS